MYYYYLFFCFNLASLRLHFKEGGGGYLHFISISQFVRGFSPPCFDKRLLLMMRCILAAPPPPPTASALLSFGWKNCCFRSGDPMRSRLRMAAACSEQVEHLEIYRIPTWFSPQNEGGGGGSSLALHYITDIQQPQPPNPPPPPHPVESVQCYP